MEHYIMVFSDFSGHTTSKEVTLNVSNLQQASLRAVRELWAEHRKAPSLVRVAILKRQGFDVTLMFSAAIQDVD